MMEQPQKERTSFNFEKFSRQDPRAGNPGRRPSVPRITITKEHILQLNLPALNLLLGRYWDEGYGDDIFYVHLLYDVKTGTGAIKLLDPSEYDDDVFKITFRKKKDTVIAGVISGISFCRKYGIHNRKSVRMELNAIQGTEMLIFTVPRNIIKTTKKEQTS